MFKKKYKISCSINFFNYLYQKLILFIIMEKLAMAIRIAPKTREKLVVLKEKTGMSYGQIIDTLVANAYDFRKGLSGEAKNHILYTIVQEYDDKPFKEVINDESN